MALSSFLQASYRFLIFLHLTALMQLSYLPNVVVHDSSLLKFFVTNFCYRPQLLRFLDAFLIRSSAYDVDNVNGAYEIFFK